MSVSANVTPLHRVYIEGEARAALPSSDRPGLSYPRVPDDKGVLARMTTWMVQEGIYPIKVIQSGGGVHDGLYVEPIFLTAIYVEIRGFDPGTGTPGDVKTAIENALAAYLAIVFPFITGTDVDVNRNDTVTDLTLSLVVQRVLAGYGGEATGIGFGLAPLVFIPSYMVGQGELVVLGAINYA